MTRNKIAAATLALAMLGSMPATALAQTDTTSPRDTIAQREAERPERDIDVVKERALAAIDRRLERVARLRDAVHSSEHVTDEHASDLLAEFERTESGLLALAEEIRAAETADELRVLIPRIATDFRVYVLVTPKTWEVLVADAMGDAAVRFEEVAMNIAEAVQRAEEAGYDVGEAQAALERMQSLVAEGAGLAEAVPPAVLPLTPADWPDPARSVVRGAHADLVAARQAFREARTAAHDAVEALRAAIGDDA